MGVATASRVGAVTDAGAWEGRGRFVVGVTAVGVLLQAVAKKMLKVTIRISTEALRRPLALRRVRALTIDLPAIAG
jgi:hypothetical protein